MITLRDYEARDVEYALTQMEFGGKGNTVLKRNAVSLEACDAIAVKSCREMEGVYIDFIHTVYKKPVLLAGPVKPEPPAAKLDDHLVRWLGGFHKAAVIYCALGSECFLSIHRFQELLLGLELTGMPFFAALKPPSGYETIESALPQGFKERTKGRGVVDGGWVQQQLVLQHPSVGCFVTHCGAGSISEAMVNDCQLILSPQVTDQFINARMMSLDLKVGIQVEKGEDGFVSKHGICKAIKEMMDPNSQVGTETRNNRAKWREFLLTKGLEEAYISGFIEDLRSLVG
ncbi:cyanidin 3-O-galactoside 2''-O-xylosyltransferase FGGT1-like [Spinacia oleracea]|uniref:Cyanidin 3-O-galactoside 2''-O-xylosyltransferase FGGT1-like n=1 Tax=Spinacia oleracea TaxID=3562 RepID=A0ABM3R276_SPIOL|nr:cyanidin 3-O-galactoside 2''-O-xylosyltransferase FGGT1-like [Spinacia oleracea]